MSKPYQWKVMGFSFSDFNINRVLEHQIPDVLAAMFTGANAYAPVKDIVITPDGWYFTNQQDVVIALGIRKAGFDPKNHVFVKGSLSPLKKALSFVAEYNRPDVWNDEKLWHDILEEKIIWRGKKELIAFGDVPRSWFKRMTDIQRIQKERKEIPRPDSGEGTRL